MREEAKPLLAKLTTLRMGGYAQALLLPETIDDCALVEERIRSLGGTPLALGLGSNILAQDGELPLVLIRPAFAQSFERLGKREDGRECVRVSSSYPLQKLLQRLAKESLSGLEGLAGIPGSLGGAIAMNAGSFGSEIGNCLEQVSLWAEGDLHTFSHDELTLAYRTFSYPRQTSKEKTAFFLITEAVLALEQSNTTFIRKAMASTWQKKAASQPLKAHSAGCVFKNPPGDSAGRLLDLAGCKGKQCGGVAFSTLHANFLLNVKQGRAQEALELLAFAKNAVFQMSGILLQPEVRIVPCMRL